MFKTLSLNIILVITYYNTIFCIRMILMLWHIMIINQCTNGFMWKLRLQPGLKWAFLVYKINGAQMKCTKLRESQGFSYQMFQDLYYWGMFQPSPVMLFPQRRNLSPNRWTNGYHWHLVVGDWLASLLGGRGGGSHVILSASVCYSNQNI